MTPVFALPTHLNLDKFSELLAHQAQYALFLDIDGTLAPFEFDPSASQIPTTTLAVLAQLHALGMPMAMVTGRGMADARRMLQSLTVPIAGSHGLEISLEAGETVTCLAHQPQNLQKANIINYLQQALQTSDLQGCLLEVKPYSVALHYRTRPDAAQAAEQCMVGLSQDYPDWQLKRGKYVVEILPTGADKGKAIDSLLTYFQQNLTGKPLCPIFMGDDVTDEAGFLAVQAVEIKDIAGNQQRGMGIKVGKGDTQAHYYVNTLDDVGWLLTALLGHQKALYYQHVAHQDAKQYP